jgi:hypothetical protein
VIIAFGTVGKETSTLKTFWGSTKEKKTRTRNKIVFYLRECWDTVVRERPSVCVCVSERKRGPVRERRGEPESVGESVSRDRSTAAVVRKEPVCVFVQCTFVPVVLGKTRESPPLNAPVAARERD